jgi:hypothetical protein
MDIPSSNSQAGMAILSLSHRDMANPATRNKVTLSHKDMVNPAKDTATLSSSPKSCESLK